MASTRNINMKNEYCLEERMNSNLVNNRIAPYRNIAYSTRLPDAGINVGHIPNHQLAYNATDVESSLFGIQSTNLVNRTSFSLPKEKKMTNISFFERLPVYIPEPLVIEKNQRPFRP